MTTVMIALLGLGLLGWLGVHIGTQLEGSAQRRANQRLVDENRFLDELGRTGFVVRRCDPDQLCSSCPFR